MDSIYTTLWFRSSFFFALIPTILFTLLFLVRSPKRNSKRAPSPNTYPVIGNLIAFLRNRHRFLEWISEMLEQTPTKTIEAHLIGGTTIVNTVNPLNLEHILKTNFPNYIKGQRFKVFLKDLLGQGIFNVDGDLWQSQRKIASHEFNTKSLKAFVIEIVQSEISTRLMPYLAKTSERGEVVDLQSVFQRFGFDNICNLAFGDDPACLNGEVKVGSSLFLRAFDEAVEICSSRLLSPVPFLWKVKRFLNIGSERRLKEAIRVVDEYAMKIIRSRKEELQSNNGILVKQDLLSRFMLSSEKVDCDEPGLQGQRDENNKDRFLRDIIISFILAGKDSTSTALSWFFWLLCSNPRCERNIYEEIMRFSAEKSEFVENGSFVWPVFRYDELKEMHYLHAAVSEALRLFPPVPINSRLTVTDDNLPDGTFVGAGWFADYTAFAMSRMEEVWGPDCRDFVPERWLEKGVFVPASQFKFPVFHAGPRICLGKDMAYIQMKSVVASILYSFQVELVHTGTQSPPYSLSITLKMKGGLAVRLKRRFH